MADPVAEYVKNLKKIKKRRDDFKGSVELIQKT